ncbi:uncharacterized protein BDZ99DRAFT_288476 [Mytilinidion resinicola]|uniref:Transmembrane protein n=1 Tax=Mytilinidion resinicola TaxID=574789 RepID=A0A6A6YQF6_9PEZI|nr:uncharacterized protein BDZ99DRAFT_288476 [Mytilinidion resinicola]KAF2810763.1 hypothetical protein BDZ99DRAFT_288476 [Mytilinidion resinicola]
MRLPCFISASSLCSDCQGGTVDHSRRNSAPFFPTTPHLDTMTPPFPSKLFLPSISSPSVKMSVLTSSYARPLAGLQLPPLLQGLVLLSLLALGAAIFTCADHYVRLIKFIQLSANEELRTVTSANALITLVRRHEDRATRRINETRVVKSSHISSKCSLTHCLVQNAGLLWPFVVSEISQLVACFFAASLAQISLLYGYRCGRFHVFLIGLAFLAISLVVVPWSTFGVLAVIVALLRMVGGRARKMDEKGEIDGGKGDDEV